MTTSNSNGRGLAVRIVITLAVHFLLGAISLSLVRMLTDGFEAASEAVQNRYALANDGGAGALADLDMARGVMLEWGLVAFVISLICALLFLLHAHSQNTRTLTEGGGLTPKWVGFLLLGLIVNVGLFWIKLINGAVKGEINPAVFFYGYMLVFVLSLVAYYVATALAVPLTMKRSVPAAELWANWRN